MGQYNRATAYNSIEYISEIEEEQIKSLQYDEDDQWITASTKMNREIREILASVGRTMAQQTSYGGEIWTVARTSWRVAILAGTKNWTGIRNGGKVSL